MSNRKLALILVLIAIAASVWCANAAKAQVITDGLVSYWTLDRADIEGDIAKDVFGNNDGEILGGKIVDGKINEALEFNGGSDFVDCGGDESLNLTDELTIELWMNPASAGEGGINAGLLCKAQADGSWNWQLRYNAPNGNYMGFQFNAVPGGATWISVQENLEPEEWHHIAGTFDGGDIVCYLNGVEKDRVPMSGINSSGDHFFIGQDGWVNIFDGIVDEVRVYNRALSEAEVQYNYTTTTQLSVKPANKLAITWGAIKR